MVQYPVLQLLRESSIPGGAAGRYDLKRKQFAAVISKLSRWDNYILEGDFNSRHRSWGCLRANCCGHILLKRVEANNIWIKAPCNPSHIPTIETNQPSTLDFYLILLHATLKLRSSSSIDIT